MDFRSPPIVRTIRLLWGMIPLMAAATTILGLRSTENNGPFVLIGMAVGIGWLVVTFFAARTGCPRCKKWFAGLEITKLPSDGVTHFGGFGYTGQRTQFDITYRCTFCGNLWITRT